MARRSHRWWLLAALVVTGGAAAIACALPDSEEFTKGGGAPDSSASDALPSGGDGSAPGEGGSSSGDTGVSLDAGGDAALPVDGAACSGREGPAMVRVGGYCIDSTEVTAADYAKFVATNPDPTVQPSECAFNTSLKPKKDIAADQMPARYVNWCDARAYCAWAGKRICGKIGGGQPDYEGTAPQTEEWFMACTAGNARAFPYGATFAPLACNGTQSTDGGQEPLPVKSRPACVGGFVGLWDMSGNVREWQAACNSVLAGGTEQCRTGGGAADDLETRLACGNRDTDPRNYTSVRLGFRCCSD